MLTVPRPGHADLAGAIKYRLDDLRTVLERASARETAMRVAVGAVAKCLIREFGMIVASQVLEIGDIDTRGGDLSNSTVRAAIERSEVRVADVDTERRMIERIDRARKERDTLGGIFEVDRPGCPDRSRKLCPLGPQARRTPGRSRHEHPGHQRRGDRHLGSRMLARPGTRAHDPIVPGDVGFTRTSNRAGGLEGGVTNGEPVVVRAAMKPISTTLTPMPERGRAVWQAGPGDLSAVRYLRCPRSQHCGGSHGRFYIADAFLEKFGGDCIAEIRERIVRYDDCSFSPASWVPVRPAWDKLSRIDVAFHFTISTPRSSEGPTRRSLNCSQGRAKQRFDRWNLRFSRNFFEQMRESWPLAVARLWHPTIARCLPSATQLSASLHPRKNCGGDCRFARPSAPHTQEDVAPLLQQRGRYLSLLTGRHDRKECACCCRRDYRTCLSCAGSFSRG